MTNPAWVFQVGRLGMHVRWVHWSGDAGMLHHQPRPEGNEGVSKLSPEGHDKKTSRKPLQVTAQTGATRVADRM